ncbi:DUF4344 domain-containing metallopeptidase [Streptomyces sp. MB09-01]|uniref:DUF4344 domain-containing metallopeptidase n=1 Tax=Streptomyces sp. MB09-01 TaxID=3028666 RepID=UPI0029A2A8E6|nr:DUF4344 domain-containing metallopeptidase [Streptomyces sp. MB09-01]MDX3535700.1 DUF4344 domain-containing metallopeptidase [Streptomyces sp. MB09-01]
MPKTAGCSKGARILLSGVLVLAGVVATGCSGEARDTGQRPGAGPHPQAARSGRVTVVYEAQTVEPEDREAMALIRKSRVLERSADWVNRALTLPHDMVVKVTADVPPGVTDAVTQPDGRTIFIPPSFLTEIEKALVDVVKTVERPAPFPASEYNADDLTVLSTEFIFGHEMGHALQRQLLLANLGLEEDAADGFASFYTVNQVGPGPSLAAAILFDEVARKEGQPTLEGLASDHPVTQQRAFNFLCYLEGSDPKKYQQSLVDSGYLPKTRAPLCPQAWAMLDYGWWTQLRPHFSATFRAPGDQEQKEAHARLIAETKALAKRIDEIRSGQ